MGPVPEESTGMYVLRRVHRADSSRLGDIVPLSEVALAVELLTYHGAVADRRFTYTNSLECAEVFLFNHFSEKEKAHAILRRKL